MKIKKDDKVIVLSGKDKGKTGKVLPLHLPEMTMTLSPVLT